MFLNATRMKLVSEGISILVGGPNVIITYFYPFLARLPFKRTQINGHYAPCTVRDGTAKTPTARVCERERERERVEFKIVAFLWNCVLYRVQFPPYCGLWRMCAPQWPADSGLVIAIIIGPSQSEPTESKFINSNSVSIKCTQHNGFCLNFRPRIAVSFHAFAMVCVFVSCVWWIERTLVT